MEFKAAVTFHALLTNGTANYSAELTVIAFFVASDLICIQIVSSSGSAKACLKVGQM